MVTKFEISQELIQYLATEQSRDKQKKFNLMKQILISLGKTEAPLCFKGGSSIMFFYGGDRFSDDLDFDALIPPDRFDTHRVVKDLQKRIAEISNINIVKDTNTTKRLKIYSQDILHPLKMDVSFREALWQDVNKTRKYCVKTECGIYIYEINYLTELKLNAISSRVAARDVYDIGFIADRYYVRLSDDTIDKILKLLQEKSLEDLMTEYEQAFEEDPVLGRDDFYLTYSRLIKFSNRVKENPLNVFKNFSSGP